MPRNPRSYIQTSYFHIMTQGINRSYIFEYSEDIKYYISIMYKLKEECNIDILAYCIMNNHAHILIKTISLCELSKYMQRLNTKYAKYYNKKYDRVGYVFRDRYKCEGIYSEEQLYNCVKYIYNNPVKAGICNKPEEYKYSNYKRNIPVSEENEYNFIDINDNMEDKCQQIIQEFLLNYKIKKEDLKQDKQKLRLLLIELRDEYAISFRKIEKAININRETLRKVYKY